MAETVMSTINTHFYNWFYDQSWYLELPFSTTHSVVPQSRKAMFRGGSTSSAEGRETIPSGDINP